METSQPKIGVVIAEDHAMFREGLRKLLETEPGLNVVGEATDGEEAVKLVCRLNPHILLLDLSLPRLSGLAALRELSESRLQTRTIILTASIEKHQVVEALQLGARGIVLKDVSINLLIKSIRCVKDGQYWIGHESVVDLIHAFRQMNPSHPASNAGRDLGLTPREVQVVALVAAGYTNKDFARKLAISEHTAKHHLTNIFDKLGVSNRLELVLFAIEHGLVSQE